MSLINDAKSLGNGSQNLILETAGRIYVKVADRFYELNFRDQGSGKVEQNVTNNTTIKEEADLSNYVTKKDLKASLAQYITKRDWQDVKQTQKMLEEALLEGFTDSINPITVQTMQMIVGSDQLQFEFIRNIQENPYIVVPHNFGIEDGRLFCDPGIILHHTIDGPQAVQPGANNSTQSDTKYYCRWTVQDPDTADHVTWFDFGADDQAYYLYIKAQKLSLTEEQKNNPTDWQTKTGSATFFLSDTAVELDPDDGYYYFLYAIINSDTGDGRSIGTMNGFTEILPGQITAYIFKSADGIQFVDFLNKQFHIGYAAEPGELSPSGSANNGSYMHWDEHNGLVIKGNITVTGGELQETLDSLQAQIDDEVQAWFSDDPNNDNVVTHCRPTLNTWPAKNWTTDDAKKEHNGDLYLITDGEYQGEMYRFGKHDGVWGWIQISDNAVAEALNAAHEAQETADTATAKINSWIDDGVISPTELIGLREEYEFVQSDWNNIHKEADLYGLLNSTEYTNYNTAKVAYYNWLGKIITSYDNADEDVLDEFGNVDLDACKTKYSLPNTFKSTMETYYSRRTTMYEKIATSVNTGISNAQTTATNAQTAANTVTQHVTKSLSDGVLTQDEISVLQTYLKSLADQYNALTGAYDDLIAQANEVLSDSDLRQTDPEWIAVNAAKNALNTATTGTKAILDARYQALVTAAQNIISQGVTPVGSINTNLASLKTAFDGAATNFTTAIGNYTEDIKELEIAIANANKMLSVAGYKYLKEAIEQGATTIAGGLILSNLLELRTIVEGESGEVTAGINGIVMDTINKTDIAAWFGGEMLDKANYYNYAYNQQSQRYEWTLKPNKTDPGTIAKTVFRHDGTGYIANGNIGWNSDGSGWVAGGALWWNAQGVPTIGGNITIDGSNETFITLSNKVSQILSWFDFDQVNSAIYVKNNYGFYSNSFVSAGGVSTTQGSEGTNLEVVWASLTNQLPDTTYNNVKIVPAHIPIATTTTIGGVKIGSGLEISQDGTLTSASGTVTSIGLEMPNGFSVSNSPITVQGNIRVAFASGYSLPTTTKQNQWDTAYGWGDHAQAGYAAGSDVVTLQGYFTNGSANSALRLSGNSTYSLWGVEYWANGVPKSVTARPTLYIGTTQVQIGATAQALTGITYGELSSYLKIGMGSPASSSEGTSVKENRRIYFGDTNHYVELTKEGYFHFSHGLYSDSFVSAGGVSNTQGSSGIDSDAMWELLATSGNEQIDESHLATALTNYVNNVTVSGTGNYISDITKSGHTITVTKATLPVQTIYALTIKNSGGITELTYTPNSAAATLTLTAAMVGLGNVSNMAPSDYFTDFSNITTGSDANKVSITIGGVTKKLEIGYVTKAQKDASGNIITSSYGASLSAASNALKLIAKDGTTTLSTITAANLVTVLGNTAVGRATSDANGNNIYNTYVSGVAVGTSTNSDKLAITKGGNTTYITVPYSLTVETTADTTNTLYLVGVTSSAITTLKRDTSITAKGNELTAGKYYIGTSGTASTGWSNGQFLEWDNTNKAWHLIGNFYADGFVSAGGLSSAGGSSGIDADAMWELLSDPTADKINVSHIPITTSGSGDFVSSITVNSGTPGSIAISYGSIPVATSSKLGGIKIGYTTSAANRNYAVQLSSEKAYVNVPWTDTTYKLTLNGTAKGTTGGTDLGSFYAPTGGGTANQVLIAGGNNTAPSWTNQSNLSVGTASKLGSSTVGSAYRPIYINNGTPTAVTSVKMDYLGWADNTHSGLGSLENLYYLTGPNILSYLRTSYVDVEYTNDGGVTWVDYECSDADKTELFTTETSAINLGKKGTSGLTTNDGLRITVHLGAGFYCHCQVLLMRHFFPGRVNLKVEYTTYADTTTYVEHASVNIRGNPDYRAVPFDQFIFGNNGVHDFRITCMFVGPDYTTHNHYLAAIRAYANNVYSATSNLARYGRLYDINENQAAIFPAHIYPASNNVATLGTSSVRWSTIYGVNANFSGTGTISGNTTIGGTLGVTGTLTVGTPSTNKATTLNGTLTVTGTTTAQNIVSGGTASTTGRYDIGTSSNYWRYVYANRYYLADGIYFVVDQHGVKLEGAGFYTDSFVSAGGFSNAGGASGVDLEAVWNSVGGHDDSYSSVQVDGAHLTNYYTKSEISTLITNLNLGDAATYDVASTVTSGDTTHLPTGAAVYTAINTAISSVLKFKGVTTTAISDGSTTNPITIGGSSYTAVQGDVVMYNHKEFLWTGSAWEEMGDESSWALKTISITGTGYLTGGGDLTTDRTISIDSTKLSDSQSAGALGTSSNLVTERDVYYGLPKINNSHSYTSSTTIYAPTSAGTANQILISAGGTSAPTWTNQSNLIGSGVLKIAANSSTAVATLYNANISSDTVAIKFVNGNYITASVTAAASSSPAEVSFSHNTSGATSGSYGDSNNQTPSYGGTFKVPYVTVDAYGHITGISEHTVKIPASDNTDEKVKQLAAITTSKAYPILLGYSEVTTEVTNHVNKASTLTYNPSTKALVTGGTVDGYTLNVASGYNVANNLTTSSSGSYVLDAYQGKLLNDRFGSYLPLAGGTMSGAIKRYYNAASNDPTLSVVSNSKDIWLWRVYTGTAAGTTTSAVNGFGLKYIGTGSTVNKNLILYADNQTGTAVKAVTVNQAGQIGIGTDPNTSYRAYIDGASYINGMLTVVSGIKLTTTKKIWFGDTYYIELDSNNRLHTNAGFYSDSFVSAGGVSSSSGGGGVDIDAVWASLTNSVTDEYASTRIAQSHLPAISSSGSGVVSAIAYSGTGNNLVLSVTKTAVVTSLGTKTGAITLSGGLSIDSSNVLSSTDNKVTQTATTTSSAYELLFSATADNTTRTEGARKTSTLTYNPSTKALSTGGAVNGLTLSSQTTGFKISGGTTSKTLTVGADYTLAAACAKAVVTSVDTSASLPTSKAVKDFVEGKGYVTSSGVTSITLTSGTGITVSNSGTAITGEGSRTISLNVSGAKTALGLGTMAYEAKADYVLLATAQTISAKHTFSSGILLNTASSWTSSDRAIAFSADGEDANIRYYYTDSNKGLTFNPNTGELKAAKFTRRGGTSSQFLKADGSVDSNTYLTGNQTITLSGDVSGSGTTSISVSIGSGKVTNAMLAGSIAWSKLSVSASNITSTLGTTAVNRATADADGNTISSTYVKKAGDTMSGDLIIEKTGGGCLTVRGKNANSDGGYIYLAGRYISNDRNGCKIAAVYPGSGAYDIQDLVFYSSNNRSGDATPVWVEAMRIKADTSVTIGQVESITMKNGCTIKVIDSADIPRSLSALYMSSNNNLILGYGTATAGYNTYIYGNELSFRYGTSSTIGMRVNSSGNVTIGATDLAGTTSKLYVDGALVATTVNGYTLAAACAKGVVTSLTASSTSTNLPTAAAVASLVSEYLPLAGGTMTGSIKLPNGSFINAASGYAICGVGSGGTTFYCGPGAEISSEFLLRSGNIDLTHHKAGTPYKIWDASNSNLSTIDWAANNLTVAGTSTFSDTMYVENRNYMQWKDSGGTYRNIFGLNNTDSLLIGYGLTSVTGSVVAIYGETVRLNTGMTELVQANGATLMLAGTGVNTGGSKILFRSSNTSDQNGFKIEAEAAASSSNRGRLALNFYSSNNTTSPYAPDWKRAMRISYNGNIMFGNTASGSEFYPTVYSYGPLQVGTSTTNKNLTVYGSITSSGDQVISSDATKKKNWRDLKYGVADIAKATAGVFDWMDGKGESAGTKAQDWMHLVPQLVHGEEGHMTLAYGQIAMLNTILLARRSEDHETRIKALEAENAKLKEEIKRLKN